MCIGLKSPPKPQAPAPAPAPPAEDEVQTPVVGDGYSSVKALTAKRMGSGSLKVKRNFSLNVPTRGSGLTIN